MITDIYTKKYFFLLKTNEKKTSQKCGAFYAQYLPAFPIS